MILHLVDDEKVIDRAICFFNKALPGQNVFLCFCQKNINGKYDPKHVMSADSLIFYDPGKDEFQIDVSEINRVIIHALYRPKISFIEKYIPDSVPICWLVWGHDLYGQILNGMGYPLYPFCNSHITTKEWIYNKIKHLMGYRSAQSQYFAGFVRRRISSVGCCDGDYYLLSRYLNIDNIRRIDFFYYPIEDVLGELYGKCVVSNADMIICGNSAAETNNHEYIIKCLKKIDLSGFKVVMPLSYCGTEEYINRVIELGKDTFGPSFQAYTDFMPLDRFNSLFLRAKACIYASWRQMAVGNIIVALYLGSKVLLSKHNPWLLDAQNMGLTVFTFEHSKKETWLDPLSSEERDSNRRIIENLFSSERLIQLIKEQFA